MLLSIAIQNYLKSILAIKNNTFRTQYVISPYHLLVMIFKMQVSPGKSCKASQFFFVYPCRSLCFSAGYNFLLQSGQIHWSPCQMLTDFHRLQLSPSSILEPISPWLLLWNVFLRGLRLKLLKCYVTLSEDLHPEKVRFNMKDGNSYHRIVPSDDTDRGTLKNENYEKVSLHMMIYGKYIIFGKVFVLYVFTEIGGISI